MTIFRRLASCATASLSTQPVTKIAMHLGFSTAQRFHAVFRKQFGMSAIKFAKQQRVRQPTTGSISVKQLR